jgi:hypothetical protein
MVSANPKVAEARAAEEKEATKEPEEPRRLEDAPVAPQNQLTEYNLPQESIQQFQNRPEAELPAIAPPEPPPDPQPAPEPKIEAAPPVVPEASSPIPTEPAPAEEPAPVEILPALPAPIESVPPSPDALEGSDNP